MAISSQSAGSAQSSQLVTLISTLSPISNYALRSFLGPVRAWLQELALLSFQILATCTGFLPPRLSKF